MVVRIRCAISNCYLLLGRQPVLVDTGAPGDVRRIWAALKAQGLSPTELKFIVLTHGHSAHAGGAAEIRRRTGARIALHLADAGLVRKGDNGVMPARDTLARLARPFLDEPFEAFEPDLLFRESFSLEPYGINGRVQPTPGHTPGSSSVLLGTGEALIGDILRGSLLWPDQASAHFFCHDPESNGRSLVRLAREGLLRCHPGMFGSFPGSQLGRFLTTTSGDIMALSGEPI